MPEEYYSYGGFSFLASPRGELYLASGASMITFDIAFDSGDVEDAEEQNGYFAGRKMVRTGQ